MQASNQRPLTLDASELVHLQDLTGEAKGAEASSLPGGGSVLTFLLRMNLRPHLSRKHHFR